MNIYVHMTPGMQQCAGWGLVMVCSMYHSVTGRNPPMRCRGSGVTIVRCQAPGHRSYYSLTHSPSLSGADNSVAFSAQLKTEIVNTNICYGCHIIRTEQAGNEWPTRVRNGAVLSNIEWNTVLTIWIEVENYRKLLNWILLLTDQIV